MSAALFHPRSTTARSLRAQRPHLSATAWRRTLAACVLLTGAGLVGAGALATWDATSSIESGALDTDAATAIALDSVNNTSFTTGVKGLVPGDYFNRYVDVGSTGGAPASLVTITAGSAIAPALTVAVDSCSVAWDGASCTGLITPRLSSTPLTSSSGVSHAAVNVSGPDHLRYHFTLDQDAPQALQNKSGSIKLAVSGVVRTGQDRTTS